MPGIILMAACLVLGPMLPGGPGPAAQDETAGAELTPETIEELLRQHGRLLEETERMRRRLEHLARAVRESHRDSVELGDLEPILAMLGSDDYQERQAATEAMRRSLVDRMWVLIETPDLSAEARQRMRSLLVEASAMIRLTRVAVDLEPGERDALWNLLDAEPKWLLDALGDDPDRIQEALRNPPLDHDLAAEVVQAALVRDEMRPLPQLIALNEIDDASSPLLREALLSLIRPRPEPQVRHNHSVSSNRDQTAALAVNILAEQPWPDLVGYLLAYLRTTDRFSARLDGTIVEALVKLRAREAAAELVVIAHDKRERLNGGHGIQGLMVRPGDCELVGAAMLLGLDLGDLNVQVKRGWSERDPNYYGFLEPPRPENPDRVAAYSAVKEAIENAGPFDPVPGLDEAMEEFAR